MHQKGFTFIELMVVISIIGLLSSVVLSSVVVVRKKSLAAAFKTEMSSLLPALIEICLERPIVPSDVAPTVNHLQGVIDQNLTNCAPDGPGDFAIAITATANINCTAGLTQQQSAPIYPTFGVILNQECQNL